MRIASVEQIELGNIMELSITGQAIELLSRSVATQSGWMEPEESQSSEGRETLAREDPPQRAGCDDQGRRRKRNVQCSAEGVGESCQRSDRRTKRSHHCVEERVNNLEKGKRENLAKREAAERHQHRGDESRHE